MRRHRTVGTFLFALATWALWVLPASAQQTTDEPEVPQPLAREIGIQSPGPRLTIHGFADVTARYTFTDPDVGASQTQSAFAMGELDLFVVSHIADNISFLAEIVFESDENSEKSTEIERMFIKYTVSDAFWVSLGRHHAPLGYWNETFHHGLILQPTVERPRELQFEDHGGILPVHSVGLEAGGRWFGSSWGFEYTGDVGNGRALVPDEVQTTSDANQNKALTLRLRATYDGAFGKILFGPMVHAETIPPIPGDPARAASLEERIYGGHLVYSIPHFELLSEYFYMRHRDDISGTVYRDPSYYVIAVGKIKKWSPYAGYDRVAVDPADPYFASEPEQLKRFLLGVRWDLASFNALKLEFRHDETPGTTTHELLFQTAFTF